MNKLALYFLFVIIICMFVEIKNITRSSYATGLFYPADQISQTLHRTEDFFKETEFGRKHMKDFEWAIDDYQGKRAFQAKKNFDNIKKSKVLP